MTAALIVSVLAAGQGWAVPPPPADVLERAAAAAPDSASSSRAVPDCRRTDDEEIVVCGQIDERFRIEFPPVPGQRRRLIAGEPPSAVGALNAEGCCGARGGVDVLQTVRLLRRGLRRLLGRD